MRGPSDGAVWRPWPDFARRPRAGYAAPDVSRTAIFSASREIGQTICVILTGATRNFTCNPIPNHTISRPHLGVSGADAIARAARAHWERTLSSHPTTQSNVLDEWPGGGAAGAAEASAHHKQRRDASLFDPAIAWVGRFEEPPVSPRPPPCDEKPSHQSQPDPRRCAAVPLPKPAPRAARSGASSAADRRQVLHPAAAPAPRGCGAAAGASTPLSKA